MELNSRTPSVKIHPKQQILQPITDQHERATLTLVSAPTYSNADRSSESKIAYPARTIWLRGHRNTDQS